MEAELMGGDATFFGTTYQARVIAYIYVHILAGMRLGWLSPVDDTPIAVSGETDGPGDDARIEFGDRHPAIEVQAKHGMTGGAKLQEMLARVRSRSQPDDLLKVVLVVDRSSSRWLYSTLPGDIERLRAGRHDALKSETVKLLRARSEITYPNWD
uniref:hypothetical protein n=1 Tax=Corallococcus coralloides TaxID=184914 RepID=UPI000FFEFF9D|nr:hypothetical protein [Corallococcus coralloides]